MVNLVQKACYILVCLLYHFYHSGEHAAKPPAGDISEHKGEYWTDEGSPPALSGIYIKLPFHNQIEVYILHFSSGGHTEADETQYPSVKKPASSQLPGTTTSASKCTSLVHAYISQEHPTYTGRHPSNPISEFLKKPSTMRPSFMKPASMTGMYFT